MPIKYLSNRNVDDPKFRIYHELMNKMVREILLVCSPYDAFLMEEYGSLDSRIINEYMGLNLSQPPRMTRVSTAKEALELLRKMKIDLVITMPHISDMDVFALGINIKKKNKRIPVILLSHDMKWLYPTPDKIEHKGIDNIFVWSANPDLLLALVKNVEDHLNVKDDTKLAMVRVLIFVEDSPYYRSFFLPYIYNEVVSQTQAVIDESLNEEHRLLKLRARPKILIAETYEKAMFLYRQYQPYLFGIISDTSFPKGGKMVPDAGMSFLRKIRKEIPDLPLLLLSADPKNQQHAEKIPAVFFDKNSPSLLEEIHHFFLDHLGFGNFIFRHPYGKEIESASNISSFEKNVTQISDESLRYHAEGNHFSNWFMARSEVAVASRLHKNILSKITDNNELRQEIIKKIRTLRKSRQKGVVVRFVAQDYESDIMDFAKIGRGALGGKALGLAFIARQLQENASMFNDFPNIAINIPKTLVITTDGFEDFIKRNTLKHLSKHEDDKHIAMSFLHAQFPNWLERDLASYLLQVKSPLSVRSSSNLEDTLFQPYAGLYDTYMIPNNHYSFSRRLEKLITAVKLVYASTYFLEPRTFSKSLHKTVDDSMAVIIQELVGENNQNYFYPAISGVAQSFNCYPISPMNQDDGIVHIALGFGKTVVEGEKCLRFSPKHPRILPQFSTVNDILTNCQRYFYALNLNSNFGPLNFNKSSNLEKIEFSEHTPENILKNIASTFIPKEDKIMDGMLPGPKIITFAPILKYNIFPLPEIINKFLKLGREGMGSNIEFEFAVNLKKEEKEPNIFSFLQIRPVVAGSDQIDINISGKEIKKSFCFSKHALGHGIKKTIRDIIYIKKESFDVTNTIKIAKEIGFLNSFMEKEKRSYLLVGPGRWGSSDKWLGIPVKWQDISKAGAIIELRNNQIKVDPSEGTHFFQNITSLGIQYLTVTESLSSKLPLNKESDFFDWSWINSLESIKETEHLRHIRFKKTFIIKIDGRKSLAVMYEQD